MKKWIETYNQEYIDWHSVIGIYIDEDSGVGCIMLKMVYGEDILLTYTDSWICDDFQIIPTLVVYLNNRSCVCVYAHEYMDEIDSQFELYNSKIDQEASEIQDRSDAHVFHESK